MSIDVRPHSPNMSWMYTAGAVQLAIGAFAGLGHYGLSPSYPASPAELYAFLNLARAIGLSFSISFGRRISPSHRFGLLVNALGLALIFLAQLKGNPK